MNIYGLQKYLWSIETTIALYYHACAKKCRPVVGDQPFLHGMLSKSIIASPSGSKAAVYHILQDSLYVIAIFTTPEITKKADVSIFDGPGIRVPRKRLLRKQINGVFNSATNAMSSQMYIIYLGSVPRVFKYETGVRDSNQKSVHSFEKLKKGHMFKFNSPRAWEMMKVIGKARRFRVHWDHDPRQMVYHLEHHLLKFTFKGSTVRISDWDYSCQYGGISIYTTKKLTNNVNYGNAVKGDHFCENRGEYFPRQFSYTDQIAIHIVALFIPGYSEGEIEMELYLAQSGSHHLKCGEPLSFITTDSYGIDVPYQYILSQNYSSHCNFTILAKGEYLIAFPFVEVFFDINNDMRSNESYGQIDFNSHNVFLNRTSTFSSLLPFQKGSIKRKESWLTNIAVSIITKNIYEQWHMSIYIDRILCDQIEKSDRKNVPITLVSPSCINKVLYLKTNILIASSFTWSASALSILIFKYVQNAAAAKIPLELKIVELSGLKLLTTVILYHDQHVTYYIVSKPLVVMIYTTMHRYCYTKITCSLILYGMNVFQAEREWNMRSYSHLKTTERVTNMAFHQARYRS